MIPSGVEIYIALEPVDMRLSFDRLSGLAKEHVGYDARSGALFVFFGRRKDRASLCIPPLDARQPERPRLLEIGDVARSPFDNAPHRYLDRLRGERGDGDLPWRRGHDLRRRQRARADEEIDGPDADRKTALLMSRRR